MTGREITDDCATWIYPTSQSIGIRIHVWDISTEEISKLAVHTHTHRSICHVSVIRMPTESAFGYVICLYIRHTYSVFVSTGRLDISIESLYVYRLGASIHDMTTCNGCIMQVRRQLGGRQGTLVSYDLGSHQTSGLDVTIRWAVFEAASLSVGEGASVVSARRVVASGGLPAKHAGLDGTLVLEIKNEHPSLSVSVWVLDRLPWFVRILSHTLRVESRQDSHHSQQSPDIRNLSLKHLQDAVFDLPQQRQGMSLLEYRVDVAPQASVRVLVGMRKALLHLDDFPPGALLDLLIP